MSGASLSLALASSYKLFIKISNKYSSGSSWSVDKSSWGSEKVSISSLFLFSPSVSSLSKKFAVKVEDVTYRDWAIYRNREFVI